MKPLRPWSYRYMHIPEKTSGIYLAEERELNVSVLSLDAGEVVHFFFFFSQFYNDKVILGSAKMWTLDIQ